MEIDELIERLLWYADNCFDSREDETLRKAAEVIRLQQECISDGYKDRWHRMIDDMGDNNAEQSH